MNKGMKEDQELEREIARTWKMRTLQVVPIIVGLLEGVAKNLDKLGIKIIIHCSKNVRYKEKQGFCVSRARR